MAGKCTSDTLHDTGWKCAFDDWIVLHSLHSLRSRLGLLTELDRLHGSLVLGWHFTWSVSVLTSTAPFS